MVINNLRPLTCLPTLGYKECIIALCLWCGFLKIWTIYHILEHLLRWSLEIWFLISTLGDFYALWNFRTIAVVWVFRTDMQRHLENDFHLSESEGYFKSFNILKGYTPNGKFKKLFFLYRSVRGVLTSISLCIFS